MNDPEYPVRSRSRSQSRQRRPDPTAIIRSGRPTSTVRLHVRARRAGGTSSPPEPAHPDERVHDLAHLVHASVPAVPAALETSAARAA